MSAASQAETCIGTAIDRILASVGEPAIRLTVDGSIVWWNESAAKRFPAVATGKAISCAAPKELANRVVAALARMQDEVTLDGYGARLIRISHEDRLLLFDAAQTDLFDDVPIGMLVWEYADDELRSAGDLRLIAANAASERLGPRLALRSFLGWRRKDIGPIDALSPLYIQVARTGEPAEIDVSDIDGNPFVARIFPLPRRRLGVMFEDVTVLRRTEMDALEALRANEDKYRTLVENTPVVLWTIFPGGTEFVSPRAERIMGYTSEEILSPEFAAHWTAGVHPEDLPRTLAAYGALFRDGTPIEVEYRFRCKDGVWKWVSDHAIHTYQKDGRIVASGVSQDITERKRAESQQIALADFGRRALTSTDEQTLMTDACRTVVEVLEVPWTDVIMLEMEGDAFTFPAGVGSGPPPGFRVPNEPTRLPGLVLMGDEPIVYSNLENETRFVTDVLRDEGGTRAGIAAPIRGRAARHGVLHARTNEPRVFSDREAAFVQSMANILAEAIERNRAERELERQKAQLSKAQALAHIGSLHVDLESKTVEWSDELYRIFGMEPQSREVSLDFVASRMASPESRERVLRMAERFRAGEKVDEEHVIVGLDGITRTAHYRAQMVVDAFTARATVVGTVQDITAAKHAEATLREQERRLQVIVSRLPVMLFSADMELRLTSLTGEGFAPLTNDGLPHLGLTLADLIGPSPQQDGPLVALAGRETTYDVRHGKRHLRVHIEPLNDDRTGATIGIVGIAFDATEEHRAEEANRMLLERIHDAARQWRDTFDSIEAPILIVDEQVRVRRMNGAALCFSRFNDYRDALDQPVLSFGDAAIWAEIDGLARRAQLQQESINLQYDDGEGSVWDLMASCGQGQTVIILSEVTKIVRMQERLRRAEQMSEMGALVAGVAHEVRNPLFGISATLDAFENRFGTAQFKDYIAALREQVERMTQLMRELLEFGRPVTAELRPHYPAPVLHRALSSMELLARQRGVTLRCAIPITIPQVLMERQHLLQVFENLLKNAIEHSSDGGEVYLRARLSDDATSVVIEVKDRGPGFSAEDLPRVFEPFFTRRRGGTGLGLSLARRIVDEHHGTVRASNRANGGASMVVTLPVVEAARDAGREAARTA